MSDLQCTLEKQMVGLLLGTAVGDALGLPREGLSAKRSSKLFGKKIQHSLIVFPKYRFGLCSDDTEHTYIIGQCLLEADFDDSQSFLNCLASRLRGWFIRLPAGMGMATLKACFKLCLGMNPTKTGIASAGNGAAMRAALIGAFFYDNQSMMEQVLRDSTCITHTDPKALEGAWVIAMAASKLFRDNPRVAPIDEFFAEILPKLQGKQLVRYLRLAQDMLSQQATLPEYLLSIGLEKGITGYINYTVPAVIYAWLRYYGNYKLTIAMLINAGGDTDTTAAIAGALAGATSGKEGIPIDWLNGVKEWPASLTYMEYLAKQLVIRKLSIKNTVKSKKLFWPLLISRNLFFLMVVLFHGFRRLLPPW